MALSVNLFDACISHCKPERPKHKENPLLFFQNKELNPLYNDLCMAYIFLTVIPVKRWPFRIRINNFNVANSFIKKVTTTSSLQAE